MTEIEQAGVPVCGDRAAAATNVLVLPTRYSIELPRFTETNRAFLSQLRISSSKSFRVLVDTTLAVHVRSLVELSVLY